jgi:hypothetical protein
MISAGWPSVFLCVGEVNVSDMYLIYVYMEEPLYDLPSAGLGSDL